MRCVESACPTPMPRSAPPRASRRQDRADAVIAYLQVLGTALKGVTAVEMAIDDLRVIVMVLAFVAFVGIVFWAYSRKRKRDFDEAARLPFTGKDFGDDGKPESGKRRETMSDFTGRFWSWYIAVLDRARHRGLRGTAESDEHQTQGAGAQKPELHGHVWDEDLAEYNNPLPRWWMWLFYLTIVFALVYLVLYPGLGSFAGIQGWTSRGQHEAEVAAADSKLRPDFQQISATRFGSGSRRSGSARDRATAVPDLLRTVPRLGCRRRPRISQLARQGLAVRRRSGNDQGQHHGGSERCDAADERRGWRERGREERHELCVQPGRARARFDQGRVREGTVRRMRGVPRRRWKGQSSPGRAQPDRQDLALWRHRRTRSSKPS